MPIGTPTGTRTDPYRAYNYKMDIAGVTEGHFTQCSGLGVKVHAISYREGGTGEVVRRLPGPVEYADLTLRYGLTNSRALWDWMMSAATGKVARKNVSIVLMDTDGVTEVMRWELIDAWPSEWRGSLLDALAREVAIESVTLVYESLRRA
jgi:phage tail-like protein